ncbi:MAG: zinc ribbon domain-containing protein [Chitinophagaceae bacterium]|nr:zinc ribbon domain-containing protein [Chitinophagaceae bacterium]
MIYCSNCGKSIPVESKFCTFCGTAVPTLANDKNLIRKKQAYTFSNRPADFIRSPGFWGSLLVLAGFFLPWIQDINKASGLNIITMEYTLGKLVLLIFPLCALFILIDSISSFLPSGAAIFFKILPFLLLVVLITLLIMGSKQKGANVLGMNISDMQSALKLIGIGLWLTVIGSVLMLFHKRSKWV